MKLGDSHKFTDVVFDKYPPEVEFKCSCGWRSKTLFTPHRGYRPDPDALEELRRIVRIEHLLESIPVVEK